MKSPISGPGLFSGVTLVSGRVIVFCGFGIFGFWVSPLDLILKKVKDSNLPWIHTGSFRRRRGPNSWHCRMVCMIYINPIMTQDESHCSQPSTIISATVSPKPKYFASGLTHLQMRYTTWHCYWKKILHQLIGTIAHYVWIFTTGFIHPRWLAGFLPSTLLPYLWLAIDPTPSFRPSTSFRSSKNDPPLLSLVMSQRWQLEVHSSWRSLQSQGSKNQSPNLSAEVIRKIPSTKAPRGKSFFYIENIGSMSRSPS